MLQTMGLAAFAILAGTAILVTLRSGDDEDMLQPSEHGDGFAAHPADGWRKHRHLRVVR